MNTVQIPRRFARSEWGGTETVVLETSRRLIESGHQATIVCSNALDARPEEVIEGVPVRRVPYFYPYVGLQKGAVEKMDKKGGNMFSFALLKTLLEWPDLDLIHLHTLKRIGGIGRHVARHKRIPYVVSLHGGVHDVPVDEAATWTEPTQGAWEWGRALGWWVGSNRVLADADAILCVGEAERKATQARYPDRRVVWLPNGVDFGRFSRGDGSRFRHGHHIPLDAFVVLNVGRIDAQKNQLLLVETLPHLLITEPRAHLVLIGPVTSPEYRRAIEQRAAALGLENRVTLLPGLDAMGRDLVDAYHAADVFVLPSIHEPFGIVILEAWASGKPVVASRVGGIPAFVDDGKNGLLFDSGDGTGLLTALRSLSGNPACRRELAEAGRRKAQTHFDWAVIAARQQALYADVVGASRAARGKTLRPRPNAT